MRTTTRLTTSLIGIISPAVPMLAMADPLFNASPGVPFVRTYCIEKVTSRSEQTVRTTYREGPCTLGRKPRGYEIFGHNWEKRDFPVDEIDSGIVVQRDLSQSIVFTEGSSEFYVFSQKPSERP